MEKLFETRKDYGKWIDELIKRGSVKEVVSAERVEVFLKRHDGWEDFFVVRIKEIEMERFKNTWGGARAGAGRKKGEETTLFSCRMKVETKEYLKREAEKAGITVTECLETIIQIFRDEHKEG